MKSVYAGIVAVLITFSACHAPADAPTASATADPLDLSAQDSSERPQNNFFLFANGDWLKKTVIPASQSSWGAFTTLRDSTVFRLHRILDSLSAIKDAPSGSLAQQTGNLFTSAMDSAGIEKKGLSPIQAELNDIYAVKNKTDLYKEIFKEYTVNHAPFFSFYVSADDRNSLINAAHFDQGGLGLPNRDYYFKKDTTTQKIRAAYQAYIVKVFTTLGKTQAEAAGIAKSIFELETAMASASKDPVALRDPITNYHKIVVSSKPEIKKMLEGMEIVSDTILVGQPEFYQALNKLFNQTPVEILKNYLVFHLVNDDADYLPHELSDAKFAFTKLQTGQSQMRERWKRMTNMIDQELGDNLGRIYAQQYFTAADRERISHLVDNIIATYAERIQQLDWMSDSTKEKALVKLHAIVKKVGFPDKWKDYSSITITKDDIIANLRATANYRYQKDLAKIGKPVDRTEWQMTPPTVNAYYEPTQNNINFPAGILQPPFYFSNGDDAVNYGGIGLVIGHEITHGFDDQGRQYDGNGNLKDWWSAEDAKKFKARAENIISQYNGYIAADTFHINGRLTEGENIADNGGLTIAYQAFKKTAQGKSSEKINGLTPDQRFFLSHAQVWRTKQRTASLITQALTNPHSAPMWRVNGPVSNMPAFYEAFNVHQGDSMYRPDSLRVKIW